jgi:RNA polymerase sigma factor (TIGR02999 family)
MVECRSVHWDSRAQFFALAAQLMRQVLVDYARKRNAGKRGAGNRDLTLDDACALVKGQPVDLLRLNDALNELARLDPKQSRIVELRFFGGLSIEETAHVLGMSPATVKRHWASARVWLHHEMS